jgi:Cu/Ag efflux protein CusF
MYRSTIVAASLAVGLATASLHADDRGTGTMKRDAAAGHLQGVVRDVDRQDGKVTIESHGDRLTLQVPASAVRDLRMGDRVALGIRRIGGGGHPGTQHGDAPASARPAESPEMQGTVGDLDRDAGEVTIESRGTKHELRMPPAALRDIREGDRVAVVIQKTGYGDSTQYGDAPAER